MSRLTTWVRGGRRSGRMEFSSEATLGAYLRAHPKADRSKHSVKSPTVVPRPERADSPGDVTGKRTWTTVPPTNLIKETFEQHFTGGTKRKDPRTGETVWDGGTPTPKRAAQVHEPILKEALEHVRPVAPGQKKIAIMTMGGPGSGKSSALGNLSKEGNFVHVDPDAVREKLPEWKGATRQSATYTGAAAKTHEESSYIAKQMQKRAIEQGKNVIIVGTGGNPDKFEKKMKDLQAAGYDVHVMFTHAPTDEGIRRAEVRGETKGRTVPEYFARATYAALPETLARIKNLATSVQVFDNTTPGGKPKLVFSRREGKETTHDEAAARPIMEEVAKHGRS